MGHDGYVGKHVSGKDRFCTVQDSKDPRSDMGPAFGIFVAEIRGGQRDYRILLHRVPERIAVNSSTLDEAVLQTLEADDKGKFEAALRERIN